MIYNEYPEKGELVIGTIKRVNPFSALVLLEGYNKEGMIHISEVARKWIRDIREFVKVGQKVVVLVLDVDKKSGHIALSLKRVNRIQAEEKLQEFKREKKAEKMLELVAKEIGISLKKAYKEIGIPMQESFGEIFKGFLAARESEDLLIKKGIPNAKIIRSVAEKSLELKKTLIKGLLELECHAPNGIEIIKKSLAEAEKMGIEVKYISAPRYMLCFKTKKPKEGEKLLKRAADSAINIIKKHNGIGNFKIGE